MLSFFPDGMYHKDKFSVLFKDITPAVEELKNMLSSSQWQDYLTENSKYVFKLSYLIQYHPDLFGDLDIGETLKRVPHEPQPPVIDRTKWIP
jgi:hypothetical protein